MFNVWALLNCDGNFPVCDWSFPLRNRVWLARPLVLDTSVWHCYMLWSILYQGRHITLSTVTTSRVSLHSITYTHTQRMSGKVHQFDQSMNPQHLSLTRPQWNTESMTHSDMGEKHIPRLLSNMVISRWYCTYDIKHGSVDISESTQPHPLTRKRVQHFIQSAVWSHAYLALSHWLIVLLMGGVWAWVAFHIWYVSCVTLMCWLLMQVCLSKGWHQTGPPSGAGTG